MKESMRKPVLFFMDLMVVFLAVILTIELIAIAGFTFPFMETGHRTSAFLRRIQGQEYQKCVEYYYENEANGVEPDDDLKECYGVAKYYEAAWQRMRYLGGLGIYVTSLFSTYVDYKPEEEKIQYYYFLSAIQSCSNMV